MMVKQDAHNLLLLQRSIYSYAASLSWQVNMCTYTWTKIQGLTPFFGV